jgi:ComF family protein
VPRQSITRLAYIQAARRPRVAGAPPLPLYWSYPPRRPARLQAAFRGLKEGVFSSSGDPTRIPVGIQASGVLPWTAGRPARNPSALTRLMRGAAQSVFTSLFPADCRLCRRPLLSLSRLPVCAECLQGMLPAAAPACRLCGEGLLRPPGEDFAEDDGLCPLCRRLRPRFVRALAYGSYEGSLRGLLHLLKYEQVRPAAAVLGSMLAEVLRALAVAMEPAPRSPLLLVPVPLHAAKHRQRGFNQSAELARAALHSLAGRGSALQMEDGVLRRVRATRSQTGLTRQQRRANLRGAFAVQQPARIAGADIILVDDVFTTGTTVSECARVLLRAGAARVYVATVARVMRTEAGAALPHLMNAEPAGQGVAAGA